MNVFLAFLLYLDRCLQECINKYDIPLENILSVVTDGAPAVVERYRSFATFLKEKVQVHVYSSCQKHKYT